ncbi:MAG: polyprenyl synthetase family protein [Spirochaetaceae bacterium]|nr:polyprenyl synthetase family protein [Spirochaetaceae bacterium]
MKFDYTPKIQKIEDILDDFLPDLENSKNDALWQELNFSQLPAGVETKHFNQLVKPCRNLIKLGGKRWRPIFMVLCAELIKNEEVELAYKLTPLVELVHTASLIHDDIEDGADERRGQPATHITWGIDTAINSASWLYFSAFSVIEKEVSDLQLKNSFYQLLSTQLRRLHLGQAMDIFWHRNPEEIPTQESYSAMVRMKTGTLASLSAQAGIIAGGGTFEQAEVLGKIASEIGEGFQVLDDVINITTGNKGKKRGDDIIEGKKSLPIILHLQKNPDDKETIIKNFELANKEGIESSSIENTIQLLEYSGVIDEAKNYASNMIENSCKKIKELYNNNEASLAIENLFMSLL